MLIDNQILFRMVDQIIGDAIEAADGRHVAIPVREAADSVMLALGCDAADRAEIMQRISVRCISRGVALEFRDTTARGGA